jgi:hypothetical protein
MAWCNDRVVEHTRVKLKLVSVLFQSLKDWAQARSNK